MSGEFIIRGFVKPRLLYSDQPQYEDEKVTTNPAPSLWKRRRVFKLLTDLRCFPLPFCISSIKKIRVCKTALLAIKTSCGP